MSKIYFFIPSDIYIRDFDSRLLLATSIMNKTENINFVIGSQFQVNNFIVKNKEIKKMIYLEKGIDMRYSNWYYYLANRGCLIYTLSEEGGIFEKNRNLISFEIDTDNLDLIKKNFIWSKLIYDVIYKYKRFLLNHSEFVTTGNPRFDLCSEKFNDFYHKSLEKYKEKKCIVISSTFTSGNSSVPDELKIIRLLSKPNYLKNSYHFDINRKKYSNKLRNYFIELTKEISKENPEAQIFFRPHPVESHEIYLKQFKGFKNIIVNNSVPARDMIAISETLIHHDCTTAIECYLNNKNPIAFLPIFDEKLTQEIPIKISILKQTIEDVKKEVNSILNKEKKMSSSQIDLKYFLENVSFSSYKKITDIFVNDLKSFNNLKLNKPVKFKMKYLLNCVIAAYIRFNRLIIETFAKLFLKKNFSKLNKFSKNVELDELQTKISSLSKKIFMKKNIKIKKLKDNLFLLNCE